MNGKYQPEGKGTWHVSEMLKQNVKAFRIKIKRYEERCFHLNKTVCLERIRSCSMTKQAGGDKNK